MKIVKRVMAPVRIDFAGGTTDIYPFTHIEGGAVLNAAIDRYIVGELIASDKKVSLRYYGNVPTSSGLGTSGVMNLVWLALISNTRKRKILAEKVYGLERALGIIGGKQDQYAAAYGGINFLEFIKDEVRVNRLKLPKNLIEELEDHLILVYTGKPHYSVTSNRLMVENLKSGKTPKNLIIIKKIAIEMKNALLKKDLDEFANLMNAETEERKKLHKSILPLRIQNLIKKGMKNGAISAKICGAGNGGSILFYGNKKKLKETFKDKVIDFKFDFQGLRWL